jgi:hypothetical protein
MPLPIILQKMVTVLKKLSPISGYSGLAGFFCQRDTGLVCKVKLPNIHGWNKKRRIWTIIGGYSISDWVMARCVFRIIPEERT